MNQDPKPSYFFVKSPKISSNITDSLTEIITFLIYLCINILILPFIILIRVIKRNREQYQTKTISQSFENTYQNYSDSEVPSKIDSLTQLQAYLNNSQADDCFGLEPKIVCEYFLSINELLRRFYNESIDSDELACNLVFGARLIMNVRLSSQNESAKKSIQKCSHLINQGGRNYHKYTELCKEVMKIVSLRIQSNSTSGLSNLLIESNLKNLKNICDKNKLEFPKNLLVDSQDEIQTQIDEVLKKEKRGFKFPLKIGQVITLFLIIFIFAFSIYWSHFNTK